MARTVSVFLLVCLFLSPSLAAPDTDLERAVTAWAYAVTTAERAPDGIKLRECFSPEALRQLTLDWDWRADLQMVAAYRDGTVALIRRDFLPIKRDFIAWTRTEEGRAADDAMLTAMLRSMIATRWRDLISPELRNKLILPLGATDGPLPVPPEAEKECTKGYCNCDIQCPIPEEQGRCDCLTVQYDDPLNPAMPTSCEEPRKDCDAEFWTNDGGSPKGGGTMERLTKAGAVVD